MKHSTAGRVTPERLETKVPVEKTPLISSKQIEQKAPKTEATSPAIKVKSPKVSKPKPREMLAQELDPLAESGAHLDLKNKILHNYTIEKVLGKGSYGVVFKALQKGTNKGVALKVMVEKCQTERECVGMLREIQLLQGLTDLSLKLNQKQGKPSRQELLDGINNDQCPFIPKLITILTSPVPKETSKLKSRKRTQESCESKSLSQSSSECELAVMDS